MQTIKIATYNVNGLVNPIKRSKILTKLKRDKVEVAFLQETHLSDTEHATLNRIGFKYRFSSSYANGYRRGVAILISSKIDNLAEYIQSSPKLFIPLLDMPLFVQI